MNDSLRLNWKMRYEWYPNARYLKGFDNLLSAYLPREHGRILDIGCGQSPFILDMLDSDFELNAQDAEAFQIDYLKQRITDKGYPIERVNYSITRFPSTEFHGKFHGVILSNVLHFYTLDQSQAEIISPLIKLLEPGALLCITVHSKKHLSNKLPITKESQFQHFFNRTDLNLLFPKEQFRSLCYLTQSSYPRIYDRDFYKAWIQQFHHDNDVFDQATIQIAQNEYLKNGRQDSITVVYKMKNSN